MPIELACPSCRKTLQVPDHAAGKKARCPACGEIIPVPAREPTVNPYTAPAQATTIPESPGEEGIVGPSGPLDVGRVWSEAWELYTQNLGILVGASAVFLGLTIVMGLGMYIGVFVMAFAASGAAQNGGGGDAVMASVLVSVIAVAALLMFLISSYLQIGITRICLDISRRQPTSISRLFSGGDVLLPYMGYSILYFIVMELGLLLCIIPGIWVAMVWWPGFLLIVDRRSRVMDAFGMSQRMVKGNFWNCFIILLLAYGAHFAASSVCGLLTLFTLPLISMVVVTTYRHLAGDPQPQASPAASGLANPMAGPAEEDSPFA